MDSEPELKAPPPPPLLALPQLQADGATRLWNPLQRTRWRPTASMLWAAAVPMPSSSRRQKACRSWWRSPRRRLRRTSMRRRPPPSRQHRHPPPQVAAVPSLPSAPLSSLLSRACLRHGGSTSGAEADGKGDGGATVELVVQRPLERKTKGRREKKKRRREKKIKKISCHRPRGVPRM
ncbi:Os09g0545051 [Oryza sativa Japonica Group]|uniref:Os09g0545051 protein n=1 Tax=Oryza sativa subsp. japonica TaxID=39947 RepID=A0A0P0XPY2_ORYSJ|nr:hypothetical protein EE612_049286 [Oryza sativa]BAT09236.1 Os09g0545051 [Oryza sativa Japonica Group]